MNENEVIQLGANETAPVLETGVAQASEKDVAQVSKFSFTIDLDLEILNGNEVHVTVPRELRLTRPLLSYITEALAQRGLELKHLKIAEEHKKDLREMPDATVEEDQNDLSIKF